MIGVSAMTVYAGAPTTTAVRSFSDGSVIPGSSAGLIRTDTGVSATLATSGLPAGDVVTMWWVVFNHPENCSGPSAGHPFQCGRSDLGNPAVEASVLYAAGRITSDGGAANYGAHLSVGDTSGALFGPGLLFPRSAHVHLVLHDHGPADPAIVSQELHSFGVCNPTCMDVQFVVFES
jgi:hypothetical protein